MGGMPETRALLGVDVIASASNPGYHLDRVWGALSAMLAEALDASGITPDDVVRDEPTGDGALYTFRNDHLGAVVDLSGRLDKLAERHNRWQRPDLRLRIAVHTGAVGDGAGYFAPRIHLTRLLGAPAFKAVVGRCVAEHGDEKGNSPVNSGLILSDAAFRAVFGGDYTTLVREADFARLEVGNKEFTDRAWLRVPGVDARTLAAYATHAAPAEEADEPARGRATSVNSMSGTIRNALQVGQLHGGLHVTRERS
jgi:hypothetical protein